MLLTLNNGNACTALHKFLAIFTQPLNGLAIVSTAAGLAVTLSITHKPETVNPSPYFHQIVMHIWSIQYQWKKLPASNQSIDVANNVTIDPPYTMTDRKAIVCAASASRITPLAMIQDETDSVSPLDPRYSY